jgi:hypothetical protein
MRSKADKIAEIKKLVNGEEENLVYFSQKTYCNGEKPQVNDLFEATNSKGNKVVKKRSDINSKLGAIIWQEERIYTLDSHGVSIEVQSRQAAEDMKRLSSM